MRYTKILSDGDSKTLSNLNDKLKPYGDTVIEKLDCVNHVYKRMGTGLRNLVKTKSSITGGRGGLTQEKIKKLSRYCRNAIMQNTNFEDEDA